MARALAFARTQLFMPSPVEIMRALVVSGCGLALILAGQLPPF